MSVKTLQLEVTHLTQVREDLFAQMVAKPSKSLQELSKGLHTLRAISRQIEAKEAHLESLRPLAQWERELLGI
jgi:hypothetical protein